MIICVFMIFSFLSFFLLLLMLQISSIAIAHTHPHTHSLIFLPFEALVQDDGIYKQNNFEEKIVASEWWIVCWTITDYLSFQMAFFKANILHLTPLSSNGEYRVAQEELCIYQAFFSASYKHRVVLS